MMIMKKKRIARILLGAGSILDIYPRPAYPRSILRISDADRLRSDWATVGKDIRKAMGKYVYEGEEK